jgi:PleD family two-component response regulator
MHPIIQTAGQRSDLILFRGPCESPTAARAKGSIVPRAFVVDDDQMVCVAIEVCLPRQGFEVTVADGGEAAMRALEASECDVMLIDVFMPDFLRMTIEPGAACCLRKSFTPNALLTSVNECLTRSIPSARLSK